MNKKELTEQEIRTQYITPALVDAWWNIKEQVREEYRRMKMELSSLKLRSLHYFEEPQIQILWLLA